MCEEAEVEWRRLWVEKESEGAMWWEGGTSRGGGRTE